MALIDQWLENNYPLDFINAQMLACFILAALPIVREQLPAFITQKLRPEATPNLPSGVELAGMTEALAEVSSMI